MRILCRMGAVSVLGALLATAAWAVDVVQTATLKDVQTVGSTSKKEKKQQYDLVITTPSNEYVCRSKLGSTVKPTQFVVGSTIQFTLKGQKAEVGNAAGNKVKCGIVRVAAAPAQ